jgi:parvulin-like peptidyl-prolyl isomerase
MKRPWLVAIAVTGSLVSSCQSQGVPALSSPANPPIVNADSAGLARSQKPETSPASPAVQTVSFEAIANQFPDLPDRGNVQVKVRAQVNGVAILDREVRELFIITLMRLPAREQANNQTEVFHKVLNDIIETEVVYQDAVARLSKNGPQFLEKLKSAANKEFEKRIRTMKTATGARNDDELKQFLRKQGLTLEGMQRRAEHDFIAREYEKNMVFAAIDRIGHEQILEYYRDHAVEFEVVDQVQWQDIFVDAARYPSREEARRLAEQLVARAKAGEDWATLAKLDNGDSSYRHGAGFGRRHGEIRPSEVEPILFQMHDGDVGPVVELSTGFHVFRLEKRDYAGRLPLDVKTQGEIRKKLQGQIFEKEIKRLVAKLRENASIKIVDANP